MIQLFVSYYFFKNCASFNRTAGFHSLYWRDEGSVTGTERSLLWFFIFNFFSSFFLAKLFDGSAGNLLAGDCALGSGEVAALPLSNAVR